MVGGFSVIVLPSLWLGSHSPFKDMNPFWGSLIIGVSLLVDHLFGYRVPKHAFDGRAPVAPALSLIERRRLALERLPLTVVVGTATVTFVLLLYFAVERPPSAAADGENQPHLAPRRSLGAPAYGDQRAEFDPRRGGRDRGAVEHAVD